MAKAAIEAGLDLRKGLHQRPFGEPRYDVGGVRLARPFRIVRNGPIGIFAADVAAATAFYRDAMGLTLTETIAFKGHECAFLRANTEHHTIALYPRAVREELGMRKDSICMAYGMQLGSYRQLKDAIAFLKSNGVTIRYLPPELTPGIDYAAYAIDPDGHAVMLYYYMEQIGWDGRPRPVEQRRKIDNANWPETLDALSDTTAARCSKVRWVRRGTGGHSIGRGVLLRQKIVRTSESRMLHALFRSAAVLALLALAPDIASAQVARQIERGKYMVTFGGCNDCHTQGYFLGKPDMERHLGGSDVGFEIPGLGVFVGPNLTPDNETGLGNWTTEQIVTALQTGKRPDGRVLAPIMPWEAFSKLTKEDANAIAAYLKSLKPVKNKVPGPFGPNEKVPVLVMKIVPPEQ
jgi:mono/diheme cytochrome c family protein/catechol 2,3-dioxygenase-like lactoylglutathione lyase family enzyme